MEIELKNINMFPPAVQKNLTDYLDKLINALKGSIISVYAYGSVTGGEYDPKRSDINLAFILNDASIRNLKGTVKVLRRGLKKNITVPLFLTPEYVEMSLDTFPMEFLELKETRVLLYGKETLQDIKVKKKDIRRECEYQVKGKLLTLRQAYLERSMKARDLERLIKETLRALFPVFRNMLRLHDINPVSKGKREILKELVDAFNIDTSSFMEVLDDKRPDGKISGKDAGKFIDSFLVELNRLSNVLDEMDIV